MAANKSKGTKLEIMFGKFLWNAGIRYRKMISRYLANPILSLEGLKLRYFVMVSFGMVEIGILERMTIKAIVSFGTLKSSEI